MRNKNSRHLINFILFIACQTYSMNMAMSQKSVILLNYNDKYNELIVNLVKANINENLLITPINFPEDLTQFIECCKRDTIQLIPIESYLQRTAIFTEEERLGEESFYIKRMKQLKKEKKKIFRIFGRQREKVLGLNLYISTCECVINDPWASIDRLVLIKSISRVSKRSARE